MKDENSMCPDNARLEYSLFSTAGRCLLSRVGEIKLGDMTKHDISFFSLSFLLLNQCSVSCGNGVKSRSVECSGNRGKCDVKTKPTSTDSCNLGSCPVWKVGNWGRVRIPLYVHFMQKKPFELTFHLSRKCCYQGLEGYSRDPGLERHSGSGIRQNLPRGIAAQCRIQTFR